METMYICPTSSKTCFTFGPTPGAFTLAPGQCAYLPAGGNVASIWFAPLPNTAQQCPYPHLPISDDPVESNGKLVIKVSQFSGLDSSNYSKCFRPGALKRMREASESGAVSILFNPPIRCKLSDNQHGPVDELAVEAQLDTVASHAAESLADLSQA